MRHPFPSPDAALRALPVKPTIIPVASALSVTGRSFDTRLFSSFKNVFTEIARVCFPGEALPPVQVPATRDISRQYLLERERIRIRHHVSQSTREALWVAHLAQLPQFGTLHHHAWLLQELYQQTLPLEPGMTILDLGCGTGDFARALVMNHIYRLAHTSMTPQQPVRYLGIDRSIDTLQIAEQAFNTLYRELQSTFSETAAPAHAVLTTWSQSEWEVPLPCAPQSIDRIVGHLSLSFTASPLAFLRQAVQALTPDGCLILTCLQPHTDLAGLYRDQLHLAGQDELSPSAQIFLHYLGRLREAVRHGLLHSFDREQLSDLLLHAGAVPIRIIPVLDGQLMLATARKGKSAG